MSNTFTPGRLWLDNHGAHINAHGGGVLRHDDVWYWFGEHKVAGELGNTAQVGVRVYSSRDLYNWRDEGVALKVSGDPADDLAQGCILERPKVLWHAGARRFVMWFHLERLGRDYDDARVGVAVAERVTGPYRYLHSFRPNAGTWPNNTPAEHQRPLSVSEAGAIAQWLPEQHRQRQRYPGHIYRRDFAGGQMSRDMTLFLDDDGAAWHFYSSEENGTLHVSRLADDWLRPAGEYARVHPGRFHEAPAVFKTASGDYFLITSDCSGWKPNAARLSRARHPLGPWEELGNPCRGPAAETALTFSAQGTFVISLPAADGQRFIFMADRWRPQNAIDGRYVWLPVEFENHLPVLRWRDEWSW